MGCPREAALRLAVESFAAAQELSDVAIRALQVRFDGPDLVVEVHGQQVRGRLSGNVLLAARILGVLLSAPGETPQLAWRPVGPQGARIVLEPDHHGLLVHEIRLAEPLLEAGLAWLAEGEEEEAYLCFRRALRGTPQWPHDVELLPPEDLCGEAETLAFFERSLAFKHLLLDRVPSEMRDRVKKVRTGPDEALSGRRLRLRGAIRAISPGAISPDPVERASVAEKLIGILSEINLGRTDPVPVCEQAGRLLWPLLDDQPFVQEVAYVAALVLVERLHSGERYREVLPWLDRLIRDGLLRREHLAMRYEAHVAHGDEEAASSDWDHALALRDIRPQCGLLLGNRAPCTDPEWAGFRVDAEARALAYLAVHPEPLHP